MDEEAHPWLRFLRARSADKKIQFTNRLALLQHKTVFEPRAMDFLMFRDLGIYEEVEKMLTTSVDVEGEDEVMDVAYPLWTNIFRNREESRREWCLEFYSTFTMDETPKPSEYFTKKVLHFHCGGKPRDLTIGEFGYYTGMYSQELLEDEGFQTLLQLAKDGSTTGFPRGTGDQRDYFTRVSVENEWSIKSKAGSLHSPVLRILHKMIVYHFLHRSNQWDKVYLNDAYLLRLFEEGAPRRYACTPIFLAKYMLEHRDKHLCCGHFITTMVKRFQCFDAQENVHCSVGVPMLMFTWTDLFRWGVLLPVGDGGVHRLIPYGQAAAEVPEGDHDQEMPDIPLEGPSDPIRRRVRTDAPTPPSAFDLSPLTDSLNAIQGSQLSFQNQFTAFQEQYRDDMRYLGS